MLSLFGQGLPFRQVIRSLLLHILLCVSTKRAVELLCDGVLDPDALDLLVQCGQGIAPAGLSVPASSPHTRAICLNIPFFRWYHLHDARLHAVLVNLVDELLEVTELVHGGLKHWYFATICFIPVVIRKYLFIVIFVVQVQLAELGVFMFSLLLLIHLFTRRWCQGRSGLVAFDGDRRLRMVVWLGGDGGVGHREGNVGWPRQHESVVVAMRAVVVNLSLSS